jgi:tight adherence protein B
MSRLLELPIYGAAVFLCAALIVDAVYGFIRRAHGDDDDVIGRRLTQASEAEKISLIRDPNAERSPLADRMPFYGSVQRLIAQSGSTLKLESAALIACIIALLVMVLLAFVLRIGTLVFALPLAGAIGVGPVLLYYTVLRGRRIAKFEEQLPDAIDLIVRSLKVGHPLSASVGLIAREMQEPIGAEFAIAADAISYGLSIPDALRAMMERVPVADLGYLMVAVQIQQEAGGNLVESLAKLGTVIRERFRMFRKVKAITAEGRLSAWLLSFFPILIGMGIQVVKPDYYTKVMDFPYFGVLVGMTIVMLIVNLLVMVYITRLRV